VSLSFISIFPWYIAVKFTTLSEKVKKRMKDFTNNKREYMEQEKYILAVKLINLSSV
jgi:hypothetical protein